MQSRGHVKTANNGVVSRSENQYLKPYFEVVCIKLQLQFAIGYLKFDIHKLGYQPE